MTELSPMNPCWRYHAKHGAKLITTQAELDAAEASGWRDSPGAAREAVDIDGPAVEATPNDGIEEAVLDASEAALADAEVVEALEAAEDLIIEKVQAAVSKKRKPKTS